MSESIDKVIVVTKGEKAEFDIFLVDKDARPVDLTGFDKFRWAVEADSGQPLQITQVANVNGSSIVLVAPAVLGHLKVTLGKVDTALLKASFGQDMDIEWDVTATPAPKRKRIHKGLNVEDSIVV